MRILSLISEGAGRVWTAVSVIIAVLLCISSAGCHNSSYWDEMPSEISDFISHYFPFSQINSYSNSGGTYHVRITNGPGLTFGSDYAWEAIDGYGMPMPQVLLFDQLPPAMYDYLQESEQLNGVFAIERDSQYYTATLMESTLRYDITTGRLSGSTPGGSVSKLN